MSLLRISPAWGVVAGLISVHAWNNDAFSLIKILAIFLLAGPIWGTLWKSGQLSGTQSQSLKNPEIFMFPYASPSSPAFRLVRWISGRYKPNSDTVSVSAWITALFLAVVISIFLTPVSLPLTFALVLIGFVGVVWKRSKNQPAAFLIVLATVAMPWLLAVTVSNKFDLFSVGLTVAFCLIAWDALLNYRGWSTFPGIFLALLVLVASGQIVAVVMASGFFLPIVWQKFRASQPEFLQTDFYAEVWLLAAMLISVFFI